MRMLSSNSSVLRPISTCDIDSMALQTTSLPRPMVNTNPTPVMPSSALVEISTYAEE